MEKIDYFINSRGERIDVESLDILQEKKALLKKIFMICGIQR